MGGGVVCLDNFFRKRRLLQKERKQMWHKLTFHQKENFLGSKNKALDVKHSPTKAKLYIRGRNSSYRDADKTS